MGVGVIAAVPCGYPCIICNFCWLCKVFSAVFMWPTLAGLSSLLPSMASIAFTPVISGSSVASLATTVPAMSRVLATLPTSSYQPLSSVLPLSTAVPDASVPGWASVPPRMLKRIWNLEFIDMYELLLESWRVEPSSEGCCRSQRPRRGLVTDFALWTECYATLVAVLALRYPNKTPHFMAYLRTITRASRNFEGTAWAPYDMAYRRQAANQKSLDWATIDPALYNEAFTGWAKSIPRCRYCLPDTHKTHDCVFAPEERRGGSQQNQDRNHATGAVEICRLFNKPAGKPAGNQCKYKFCRMHMYAPSVGGVRIQQQSVPTASYLEVSPGRPLLQGGRESRGLRQANLCSAQ